MIYLDNAATTKISDEVLESMMPYLKDEYYNPGGLYPGGRKARDAVENARCHVASLFNCLPKNIIFTSGGSESNNLAIKGLMKYNLSRGRNGIVTTKSEHDSMKRSIDYLEGSSSCKTYILGIAKDGTVIPDENVYDNKDVGMTSIMMVNNETGAINDVKKMCEIAHKSDSLFHTDCVQASSCVRIDTNEIRCDSASISSHKIHGPKGVGALFVSDNAIEFLNPIIHGGHEQEFGLRGGTENVAGIVGFGTACHETLLSLDNNIKHYNKLYDSFKEKLMKLFKNAGLENEVTFNGSGTKKICSVTINNIDAQTLSIIAGNYDLFLSPGSACRTTSSDPSDTLTAMGMSNKSAYETVRLSFSKYNTEEEVTRAAFIIFNIYMTQCK